MRLRSFLFITVILFSGTGCALRQILADNPIRITGHYEFVSLDLSIFSEPDTLPVQAVQAGEASFDLYHRFRARYLDPVLKREFLNLDGEFIIRGDRIELNLPQTKLNGNFRLSQRRGETYLLITWKYPQDRSSRNWVLKKK